MITTRQINVDLTKGKLKLRHVSTKDIDAGVRVEPPKEPIKVRGVSTTTLPDVAGIAEKKRRDDIMAERKKAKEEVIIEPIETITHPVAKNIKVATTVTGEQEIEMVVEENKPWDEMTEEERQDELKETMAVKEGPKLVKPSKELKTELDEKKLAMKKRMAKVRAAKAKKKDVKEDAR